MHELSIAQSVIDQVQSEVCRSGHAGRVVRLELTIGRLSGVSVDSLRFAFEALVSGTPLADAEVQIREPAAACRCRTCGAQTEIDELAVSCPQCNSPDILIEGGRQLLLQSIELED